jgi:outer membrane protein
MKQSIIAVGITTLMVCAAPSRADDLLQLYDLARKSDPLLREAEANRLAVQQGKPIARGALLPQVNGTTDYTEQEQDSTNVSNDRLGPFQLDSSSRGDAVNWRLELRQSVFRWDRWVSLSQADKQASQADVDYEAAAQDLIVRVSDAYFNVLAAEDTLASEQAAKEAIGRQLEQAQKRFEVGLIAITDVQEAQAAYDQAVAAEILAKRALANQREALRAIIDESPPSLAKPAEEIPLTSPDPQDENQWVDIAMQQNRQIISSQIGSQIAKDNVRIARAAHLPTLDFVASKQDIDSNANRVQTTTVLGVPNRVPGPANFDQITDQYGLQLQVPIFSGGQTSARVEQAVYQHRAARERLESTMRQAEQQTRDAYLGVISEISRVRALKQALESARTALQATEAGFEVGTRTTVDVLDSRRTLFVAETNYLRSRYNYLMNGLRLKQAAGTLTAEDITRINALLE